MKNIFIIPGYGIPKDILKDESYRRYLSWVFNQVYQICLNKKEKKPVIIFCGGKTDIFKPYKRTEAEEMKKLFLTWAKRDFVRNQTKDWQYKLDKKSLSTVENLLEASKIIKRIKGRKQIYIFVEFTRQKKIKKFAQEILKKNFKIIALDFDLSINRYRDPKLIRKREEIDIKLGLNSLKDKKFYQKYRKILEEKIKFLRRQGAKKHQDAVYEWWRKKLKELEKFR